MEIETVIVVKLDRTDLIDSSKEKHILDIEILDFKDYPNIFRGAFYIIFFDHNGLSKTIKSRY